MSVDLQPPELGFRRPFDHEVTEVLKLTNTNDGPVAFKVKTTAPKQYCVRPNSGVIQPNGQVEVQVLLQALKEDPPLDFKCRDKFLVQSVVVSSDANDSNLTSLWGNIEKTAKGSIQERKIRVNFLPAAGATTNGVSGEDQHMSYASTTPQFGSPAPDSNTERATTLETTRAAAANAAEASGLAGAAAAVSRAVPSSSEEMKQQLSAAQAQIAKLTSQLQDPQVRQRKVQEASEKMQTVVQQSQESGVSLQIVAILCLVSFLIAYLFF